jgi:DNA polymerase III gamma/tau subunit
LADATDAERKELAGEANEFSESDLVRFFHSLSETEQRLREGAHPRYQLEIGLAKLVEMRRLAPVSQILERLRALEEALRTGKSPAATPSTPPASSGGAGGAASRGGGGTGPPPASRFPKSRAESSAPTGHAQGHARQGASDSSATTRSNNGASRGDERAAEDAPPWESQATDSSSPVSSSPAPSARAPFTPPALRLVESSQSEIDGSVDKAAQSNGDGFQLQSTQAPPRVSLEENAPTRAADPFLEKLKSALEDRKKPFLATALDGARLAEIRGAEFYVEFAPEQKFLRDNLSKPENARLVREACSEVAGHGLGLQIVVRDEREAQEHAAEDDERSERERLRELAAQDPQVQDVLRIFRAEIVDVRPADKA